MVLVVVVVVAKADLDCTKQTGDKLYCLQVLVSRIAMAMCAMFLPPIAMAKLEKRPFLTK